MMEMKQLQYFVMSVDTGSLSKAADMLYTTQPHVSMTISKLEKSLGVCLLKRSKKGVEMTPEGELVYEQARRILKDMQVIQQVQRSVRSEVFSLSSMPSNLLAGLFADFYREEQNLQARYLEGTLEMVLHQVTHRRVELGFIFVSEFQILQVKRYQAGFSRRSRQPVLLQGKCDKSGAAEDTVCPESGGRDSLVSASWQSQRKVGGLPVFLQRGGGMQ